MGLAGWRTGGQATPSTEHLLVLLSLVRIEYGRDPPFQLPSNKLELGSRLLDDLFRSHAPFFHDDVGRLFLLRSQFELVGEAIEQNLHRWSVSRGSVVTRGGDEYPVQGKTHSDTGNKETDHAEHCKKTNVALTDHGVPPEYSPSMATPSAPWRTP